MFGSGLEEQDQTGISESPDTASARIVKGVRALGISHRSADLRLRSSVSFNDRSLPVLLEGLKFLGIEECLAVSTCNRTEIYFWDASFEEVQELLARLSEVPVETLSEALYRKEGLAAVSHLFRVTAGLDSAILGEHEVLGQIKAAYGMAKRQGLVGRRLEPLYQRALRASKRVRSESAICRNATSVGSIAVKQAATIAGGIADKQVLLIGAGQIAERVAKALSKAGCRRCQVSNRSRERADRLASLYGLSAIDFSQLDAALAEAEVVIAAVSGETPLLTGHRLKRALGDHSVVIVDLGVPPNVEAASDLPSQVHLVDMERLLTACRASSKARLEALPHAVTIVEEEVTAFASEALEREASPVIAALVRRAEEVRRRNLEWAQAQLPAEMTKERKVLEDLSIRVVRGMLEQPISALKEELKSPVERAVLARLFGVEAF